MTLLGLGTYRSRDAVTSATIAAAAGCPLIDTAPAYGKGTHQAALAPVLKEHPRVRIATKSTDRCYPVIWNPPGFEDPVTDWFHKYVVSELILTDRTGGAEEQVTRYDYQGDAAWRHAEPDGITPEEYLTWSQWRGYETVRVSRGNGQEMPVVTEHTFLRGMHGDDHPDGGTRTVSITDSTGDKHTDRDEFSGRELETTTYNGEEIVNRTISEPWHRRTATQTEDWGTRHASLVRTETQRGLVELASGGTRESRTTTTYDALGRPSAIEESGDVALDGDERCTTHTYADNTAKHLLNFPVRELMAAGTCDSALPTADTALTDTRTFYDGQGFGQAPTKGDITRTENLTGFENGSPVYSLIEATEHDAYGRITKVTHPGGIVARRVTRTDVNGLPSHSQVENALGHTIDVHYDPHRGSHLWEQDANGRKIEAAFDPLGRRTEIWHPDRHRSRGQSPSLRFEYLFIEDAPVAIKGEELQNDGSYEVSYTLMDGFLRQRQIQKTGTDGGRLVTDAFYNSLGEKRLENDTYYALGAPSPEVLSVRNGDVNGQNFYLYDGVGRVSDEIRRVAGEEVWRTTYTYGGDRTLVTPPDGGTSSTTIVDVRGNPVEKIQHPGGDEEDLTIRYTYTLRNELATVTAPNGAQWYNEYDYRGNITSQSDPDSGEITMEYDERGLLTSTVDARGVRLTSLYDELERQTSLIEGDASTGTPLVAWQYDTRLKGYLFMETRHHEGREYRMAVTEQDSMYRPTKTVIGIPNGHGALSGNYTFTTSYNQDGTVRDIGYPAIGDLPAEAVTVGYDELQRPITLTGLDTYITRTDYAQTGELLQVELTTGQGPTSWITYEHEKGTQRLLSSRIDRQGQNPITDHRYTYNDAGNILSLANAPTGSTPEVQCFDYDGLSRLVQAWTTPSNGHASCEGEPSATTVGGPAPYWTSYTYDQAGNRLQEIGHPIGQTAGTLREYTYPTVEEGRPHTLTSVTETASTGQTLFTYDYDAAGNTTQRIEAADEYTFTWNAEGRLAAAQGPSGETSFVYSSQNEKLIKDSPGESTLYLPGTEVRLDTLTGQVSASRYYDQGGTRVAMRDTDGVTFLGNDHHGTANTAITAVTDQNRTRRFTPFGSQRGDEEPWPDDKGFLGKTVDEALGIIHVGAREYDPVIGRFLSGDPVLDFEDLQQINGYAYANNTPVVASDPSGLMLAGCHCSSGTVPHGGGTSSNQGGSSSGGGSGPYSPPHIYGNYGGAYVNSVADYRLTTSQYNLFMSLFTETDSGIILTDQSFVGMDPFDAGDRLAQRHHTDLGLISPQERIDIIIVTELLISASGIDLESDEFKAGYEFFVSRREAVEAGYVVGGGANAGAGLGGAGAAGVATRNLVRRSTCGNSFVEGTLVLLADGSYKPIQDVAIGDEVTATDPISGNQKSEPVVATIIGYGEKELVEITVDSAAQISPGEYEDAALPVDLIRPGPTPLGGVVVATSGHPFWVLGVGAWVNAGELSPGMWLMSSSGYLVQVTDTQTKRQVERVYNLTVEATHTFHVAIGEADILSHNSGCSTGIGRGVIGKQEQIHILYGDATGGGHMFPGRPGKTLFPENWSEDEIIDAVAIVARGRESAWRQQSGPTGAPYTNAGNPSRWVIEGQYRGIDIRVVYEPATDRIVTGFPYM